jgi:peptidyl-tRNA hydrolase
LEPGYQAVQSMHAGIQFTFEHPEYAEHWYKQSNYLGLLSVADEQELTKLIEQAAANDIRFSIFRESDIEDQITAIALAPGPKSKKLCSKLPLALKS